jgi:hypothetical protein
MTVFLFVLTAGERLWAESGCEILRPTVELAWRRAEREASDGEIAQQMELRVIYGEAITADSLQLARLVNILVLLFKEPGSAARTLLSSHPFGDPEILAPLLSPTELTDCCRLMRELFGTQIGSPASPDPRWLTCTVVDLA